MATTLYCNNSSSSLPPFAVFPGDVGCFHSSEPQFCSCQTKYGILSGRLFSVCLQTVPTVSQAIGKERCLGCCQSILWICLHQEKKKKISLISSYIPCRCIIGEMLFLDTVASIIDTLNLLHIQPQGRPIFLLLAYLSESSRAAEIWEMYYIQWGASES